MSKAFAAIEYLGKLKTDGLISRRNSGIQGQDPQEDIVMNDRVLVVDDDPGIRDTIAQLIEELGYGCDCASDGIRCPVLR